MNNPVQNHKQAETDLAKMEQVIGQIMRIGVGLAILAMLIGMGLLLFKPTQAQATFPTQLTLIWHGLWQWQPMAWMMLGLFILIMTPVLRVIVSIIAFAKIHDHLYTIITTVVLIILFVAIAYGYYSK
ncbi:putative membrane protein [Weissella uvarum]|uniref:DUF1634 domain-containing protein n=1 Tax=Weissella uvarum TaxID=1479233 RepID=UPI00196066A9|nr:DUF1634 domain-containing protein [Weissella uvarum]MBM7617803.1 putative membrane protein [Weissella uvarum]MCM0595818.1 DUF1634 domain-containing protein [Weissella uvarum]